MYLAQAMFAEGLRKQALAFAYDVLQSAKNDAEAALRYFGLMMLDLNGHETLRPTIVGLDAWVRLEVRAVSRQVSLLRTGWTGRPMGW